MIKAATHTMSYTKSTVHSVPEYIHHRAATHTKPSILTLLQLLEPRSGHVNWIVGGQDGVSLAQ
jgi:hypothetical protein